MSEMGIASEGSSRIRDLLMADQPVAWARSEMLGQITGAGLSDLDDITDAQWGEADRCARAVLEAALLGVETTEEVPQIRSCGLGDGLVVAECDHEASWFGQVEGWCCPKCGKLWSINDPPPAEAHVVPSDWMTHG